MCSLTKSGVIIAFLLIWALSATFLAFYMYTEYEKLRGLYSRETIYVNFGINYGNSTLIWYNSSKILKGSSVYQVLLLIAESVNATEGASGVYVSGINGVNEYNTTYWFYAIYNRSVPTWVQVGDWIYPSISCNNLILENGDVVVWVFFDYAKFGSNFPVPTSREHLR